MNDVTGEERVRVDTREAVKWPYSRGVYVARLVWAIVWKTVWKVCWKRAPILRTWILRMFGGKVGLVAMEGSVWVEMPWDLEIGEYCSFGARTHLYNLGGLKMGNHVVVSQDVYLCGGTHDYTDPTYPLIRKKITIEDGVWIAAGAFVGPGVTIGRGAVVGARAVVVKDVEPWTVVAGNPARVIKRREMGEKATKRRSDEATKGEEEETANRRRDETAKGAGGG